ncbi:MAG TPA: cbb3-type cytochrome c oxidase subunit I [Verrucomicrobiae bacterium]|nr:cbb3-type cytochrome c oxidase subunit I [Verrucomicrobiae bacterium]
MNVSSHPNLGHGPTEPPPTFTPSPAEGRWSAAQIDASCRWPVLLLFASALAWLVLGSLLQFIIAIKLHAAGFLADSPWLTLGRLRPAAMDCFLYGFASQAGMGVLLWLFCRLGGIKLVLHWPLLVAGKVWNIGVTVGFLGILLGYSTGFEWLEMPRAAASLLFLAFALFGLVAVVLFTLRRQNELFPSQWFLLAGLFWFAWSYSGANFLTVVNPVRGSFQAVVNAWFTGSFLNLWLAPIAFAGVLYFVPRLTGQPLFSRELAIFAFWTQLGFGSFAGLSSLVESPVPRWIGSVGTAATVGLLLPLAINALNWHRTLHGNCQAWKTDIILRFVLFGAGCYLLQGILGAVYATPQVAAIIGFTYAGVGKTFLTLHGFVAMVLFGCLYYIVPRVAQVAWPRPGWIRVHWVCSVAGVGLVFLGLTIGGIVQGFKMTDPQVPFPSVVKGTIMFVGISTLGVLSVLVGQIAFLGNFALLLQRVLQPLYQMVLVECCGYAPDATPTVAKAGGKP